MSLDFEERTAIVTGGVQGMSDECPFSTGAVFNLSGGRATY
jgi:hypothetical protein